MSDKVTKTLKVKLDDDTFSEAISLGADAKNVTLANGRSVQTEFNSIENVNDSLQAINETLKELELSVDLSETNVYYRQLTLISSAWIKNSSTGYFEYKVTDASIKSNTLVKGYLDITNQLKMSNGHIESAQGSYTIVTSIKPTQNITMYISARKVESTADKVIGSINVSGIEWN